MILSYEGECANCFSLSPRVKTLSLVDKIRYYSPLVNKINFKASTFDRVSPVKKVAANRSLVVAKLSDIKEEKLIVEEDSFCLIEEVTLELKDVNVN